MTFNDDPLLRVVLVVGSVRSPRFADVLVPWLQSCLEPVDWLRLDVVDLSTVDLPERELRPGGSPSPISERLAVADAFVVLTPEYNHSFPSALKNAIDWHVDVWHRKPVAFVSYGAGSGGARAVEQLRPVFAELHAVTTRNAVILNQPWNHVTANGVFQPPAGVDAAVAATLEELRWWATTLWVGRQSAGMGW
jgi:NAD(P)H-dependent FMN reductase